MLELVENDADKAEVKAAYAAASSVMGGLRGGAFHEGNPCLPASGIAAALVGSSGLRRRVYGRTDAALDSARGTILPVLARAIRTKSLGAASAAPPGLDTDDGLRAVG